VNWGSGVVERLSKKDLTRPGECHKRVNSGKDGAMSRTIISDQLRATIEPLIPKLERRFRYPGRKRIPDRPPRLTGIPFVLKRGSRGRIYLGRWAAARM
jgi:hypothetical protein